MYFVSGTCTLKVEPNHPKINCAPEATGTFTQQDRTGSKNHPKCFVESSAITRPLPRRMAPVSLQVHALGHVSVSDSSSRNNGLSGLPQHPAPSPDRCLGAWHQMLKANSNTWTEINRLLQERPHQQPRLDDFSDSLGQGGHIRHRAGIQQQGLLQRCAQHVLSSVN